MSATADRTGVGAGVSDPPAAGTAPGPGPGGRRSAAFATAAPFIPAASLLAIWIAWIPLDGGYFPRAWYPAAMFTVALLAAVVLATRRWLPRGRAQRLALALLAGFTAWSFASMLWAGSPGSAWTASDQLLLYLAMAWVIALVPWRAAPATALLACWTIAVTVVCAVELVSALGTSHLGHYLFESRWQQPTGYANGAAAIAAMGFWPALMLASRRGIPAPVQVAFLATAAFLAEMYLLPQSRASLGAVVIALVLFVALSPDRLRVLVRLAIVGLALAIAGAAIWDVFGVGEAGRPLDAALDRAARGMLVSLAAVALAGIAVAMAERGLRPVPRVAAAARRGAVAVVVAAALAGAGLAVAHAGDAAGFVSDRWAEFKDNGNGPIDRNPTRIFQSTSDKRYDYWRVVVATFGEHPVGGVGAGGFEREYLRERRHPKPSRAAHSIWMRALIETGAVGTALLLAFVVAGLVGLVLVRRRLDHRGRAVVAACAGLSAYFVAHASVDWLELIPALAAPAVALPFVALGLRREHADPRAGRDGGPDRGDQPVEGRDRGDRPVEAPDRGDRRVEGPDRGDQPVEGPDRGDRRVEGPDRGEQLAGADLVDRLARAGRGARLRLRLAAAAAALLAAAAVVALALPYLSARLVDSGLKGWRAAPARADGDLRRAAGLDPLSPDPRYAQGEVALDRARYGDARRAFEAALDVEDSWYPHFELALLAARERRFPEARREIARARALNPPDPLVIKAAGLIGARQRIDPAAVNRQKLALPLYRDRRHQ